MSSTNTTNTKHTGPSAGPPANAASPAAAPGVTPRVVNPFAVACRFDRARGEFVVRAGARAGATAVAVAAVLAVGTAAFVRTCFRGPSTASAAGVVDAFDATPHAMASEPPASSATVTAEQKSYSDYVRTPGLNYLVIRSVPTKRAAERERDTLISRGVATTVECSLPGWSGKGWYSLVGMTGFDLARDQALYDRHVNDLKDLKLEPKPYKWRER